MTEERPAVAAEPPEEGTVAPDFCLQDSGGREVCLRSFSGKWVVLYFYPRDNTSGCTAEAKDFTAASGEIRSMGAEVLGVSPDTPASHSRFSEKHGLKVTLLSDPDHRAMEAYGVWGCKMMYGKKRMGVIRSTFLISPAGAIARRWRNVRVKGHVEAVLSALAERSGQSQSSRFI